MVTVIFVDGWPNNLNIFRNPFNISQITWTYKWIKVQKSIKVDLKHMWWSNKSKLTCEAQSSGKKIAEDRSCNMTTRGGHRKQRNACRLNKGLIGSVGSQYHKFRQLSMECEYFGSSLAEKGSARRFNEHQCCNKLARHHGGRHQYLSYTLTQK